MIANNFAEPIHHVSYSSLDVARNAQDGLPLSDWHWGICWHNWQLLS